MRGSFDEAADYLDGNKKSGFRAPLRRETLGDRPAEKRGQGKGSHKLDEILDDIDNGMSLNELERTYFAQFARYGSSLRTLYMSLTQAQAKNQALQLYSNVEWRPWQQDCLALIENEMKTPCSRSIHWWYEQTGNVGKSYLAGYLQLKYNALLLEAGRKSDLAYTLANAISGGDVPIVCLDFVRTTAPSEDSMLNGTRNNYLHNVYAFLEAGMFILLLQRNTNTKKSKTAVCCLPSMSRELSYCRNLRSSFASQTGNQKKMLYR